MTFAERYGPWALVAGASEGLGAAFAESLAARQLNLVLVARRSEPLAALAQRLRGAFGIETREAALDLAAPDVASRLLDLTESLDVGLVVLSAAFSPIGEFLARPATEHARLLDVNCRAAGLVAHGFGERLTRRGRGGLIFVSSLASLQGTAITAHYAASKAYLRVLGQGLWQELRPLGVDVLVCMAGPTDTPTWRAPGPRRLWGMIPAVQRADVVAELTLEALGRKPLCIPGLANLLTAIVLGHLLPARWASAIVSWMTRRMYADRRPAPHS